MVKNVEVIDGPFFLLYQIAVNIEKKDAQWFDENEESLTETITNLSSMESYNLLHYLLLLRKASAFCRPHLLFLETIDKMIEDEIRPAPYISETLLCLKEETKQNLCHPLWHLLARSEYRTNEYFIKMVYKLFEINPEYFVRVLSKMKTKDSAALVTKKLHAIAPLIKYVKPNTNNRKRYSEYLFWEIAKKEIVKIDNLTIKETSRIDQYFETQFITILPTDEKTWKLNQTKEVLDWFESRKEALNDQC